MSDERGFGVCTWSNSFCEEPLTAEGIPYLTETLRVCGEEGYEGGQCGCLVLPRSDVTRERGYYVERVSCIAYARAHPGVTCRDGSWTEL